VSVLSLKKITCDAALLPGTTSVLVVMIQLLCAAHKYDLVSISLYIKYKVYMTVLTAVVFYQCISLCFIVGVCSSHMSCEVVSTSNVTVYIHHRSDQ